MRDQRCKGKSERVEVVVLRAMVEVRGQRLRAGNDEHAVCVADEKW